MYLWLVNYFIFRMPVSLRVLLSGQQQKSLEGKSFPAFETHKHLPLPIGRSPFPEVDSFIKSVISGDGGYLRRVIWKPQEHCIEYDVAGGYRFCENVRRHHKSNNIRLVARLQPGVYFQVCHDPDCAGFKSRDVELPKEVQPWMLLFEEEEEEEDDDLLTKGCGGGRGGQVPRRSL